MICPLCFFLLHIAVQCVTQKTYHVSLLLMKAQELHNLSWWWHQTSIQALINYTTQSPSVTTFASLCHSLVSYQSEPPVPSSVLVLFIQKHLLPSLLSFNISSSLSPAVTSELTLTFLISVVIFSRWCRTGTDCLMVSSEGLRGIFELVVSMCKSTNMIKQDMRPQKRYKIILILTKAVFFWCVSNPT